jgi:hypothetical protein
VYGKHAERSDNGKDNNSSVTNAADAAADDAVSEAYCAAETALLAAVVGSDEALAALPGGPSVVGGMQQPPVGKLCFGVLLWQQLPGGLMQWPVWIERKLYVVSACAAVVREQPAVLLRGAAAV